MVDSQCVNSTALSGWQWKPASPGGPGPARPDAGGDGGQQQSTRTPP